MPSDPVLTARASRSHASLEKPRRMSLRQQRVEEAMIRNVMEGTRNACADGFKCTCVTVPTTAPSGAFTFNLVRVTCKRHQRLKQLLRS